MRQLFALVAILIALTGCQTMSKTPRAEASGDNRLTNSPDMVDRLIFIESAADWRRGKRERVAVEGAKLVLADSRNRAFPRRGRFDSQEIAADFPFTEVVPSWNAVATPDSGMTFQVRTRDARSGEWSPWLYMGQWGRTPHYPGRTLDFKHGEVNVDYLKLTRPANALQVRADLYSFDLSQSTTPTLTRMAIAYAGRVKKASDRKELTKPVVIEGDWARSLDIPYLAQGDLNPAISGSTCSPSSITMSMAYWGVNRPLEQNALDIYDREYGIFGNWARSAALPGQLGLKSYVRRFRNWDQVKAEIAKGNPMCASIRFGKGEFPSNVLKSTNGHLIVIRGFTPSGDVIVNDPASRARGDGIVYKADELARAWFDKGGVGYVIAGPEEPVASRRRGG